MGRNDTTPVRGHWGLIVAISAWILPVSVFWGLRLAFGQEEVWKQVGPLLQVAFYILVAFGQMGAMMLAGLAWPSKLARITLIIAVLVLLGHGYELYAALHGQNLFKSPQ